MGSGKVGLSVGSSVAVFDPGTSLLRYTADVAPPILLTGSGRALALPNTSKDFLITLSRGTSCFFYAAADAAPPEDIERLAASGMLNARSAGAMLALHHIERPASPREYLEYSAQPICATIARDAMCLSAERLGIRGEQLFEVTAAVGEAVANAIEHCRHSTGATFTVDCAYGSGELYIHIESNGPWRAPELSDERGRGLPIMRAFTEALEIASSQDRTRVSLSFAR